MDWKLSEVIYAVNNTSQIAGATVPSWLLYVMAASAIVVAVHTIWTKAVKPLSRAVKAIHATYERVEGYDDRLADVERNTLELRRNSGTSLRDAVDRIEAKQAAESRTLNAHLEWSQSQASAVVAHQAATQEEITRIWSNLASRDIVDAAAKTVAIMDDKERGEE